MSNRPFASLSPDEQAAIRLGQKKRKGARLDRKPQQQQPPQPPQPQQQQTPSEPWRANSRAEDGLPTRSRLTHDEYFGACPGGLFRDPQLPPTAESLTLLLQVLEGDDEQARELNTCNYFQFSGREAALWDATFNARLAWEGFFTITANTGPRRRIEPLPELQPFYGVLTWDNFENAKVVRKTLARLARQRHGYQLSDRVDPERTWRRMEAYHAARNSSNWLTKRYFEMMQKASEDPAVNFTLHCIELSHSIELSHGERADGERAHGEGAVEEASLHDATHAATHAADVHGPRAPGQPSPDQPSPDQTSPEQLRPGGRARIGGLTGRADLNGCVESMVELDAAAGRWAVVCDGGGEQVRIRPANLTPLQPEPRPLEEPPPLAGEIGFSIGGVYTSLTGWTGERTASGSIGTVQLVLLGRWLQLRRYGFWSLGHCYSPEMEYKRQLGHRIYSRTEFRGLLKRHRGPFVPNGEPNGEPGQSPVSRCGPQGRGLPEPLQPLRPADRCDETALL